MQSGSKLKNIINVLRNRPIDSANFVGAESFATWQPGRSFFGHYQSDAYASSYPSIRAIANEYMAVPPKAIDAKGNPVPSPIIDALYHPNQLDSSVAFAEKVAVSTLALSKTYILVWSRDGRSAKPGGDFTIDKVAGFTFLEFPGVSRRDGKTYYNKGSQYFTEDEVLVLPGGVDPHNLYAGYSPSEAARRWAKLDDYIADYQAGFFENGAVPAGQFLITAATKTEYDDIVDTLQARHRGAGKNGNVTYAHRPIDPNNGSPVSARIEWVPFSQSNKDIDFKNLFQQTNQRIDTAFGVPAIVKGIDDAATYANAQVAEKTFAKRAVYPLLLRNYTQLTHELNRITNGLGVSITFDYKIPTVSDEEKVDAERKQLDSTVIINMTEAGYSLESIVDAFKMPISYKDLVLGTETGNTDEDNPDVDEGGEVESAPDPAKIDGVTPVNKSTKPKAEVSDLDKLANVTRQFMQSQVDKAVEDLKAEPDKPNNVVTGSPSQTEQEAFIEDMLSAVVAIMISRGDIQYTEGEAMIEDAGLSTDNLNDFNLSDGAQTDYKSYLARVGESYSDDTAESIRNVLANADEQGLTKADTENALQEVMNTDEWRVTRLANTELNRSQSLGGLEAMKQIAAETGATMEKTVSHEGNLTPPCEFCQAQEGVWVKIDQPLVHLNQTVVGVDGGTLINDFVQIDAGDIHPNGKGHTAYKVVS